MTTVFLDLDGVLADFVGGCERLFKRRVNLPILRGEWEFYRQWELTPGDFYGQLERAGAGFWSNLAWCADGPELLHVVEDVVGPENIYLLSAPTLDPGSAAGKMDWVRHQIPHYSGRLILTSHKHLLTGPGRVLIDDNDRHVFDFDWLSKSTGRGILVSRPWNSQHEAYWSAGAVATVTAQLVAFVRERSTCGA